MEHINRLASRDPLWPLKRALRNWAEQASVVGGVYSTSEVHAVRGTEDTENDVELSEWDVYGEVCDIVREAGEIALQLGLPDTYRTTRVSSPITVATAKEMLAECLAACNQLEKAAGTISSAVDVSVMPGVARAAAQSDLPKRTAEEKLWLAIGLLSQHPDWTKSKIAEQVGVDRRTLYNWPGFQAAWRAARAKDTNSIVRGSKGKDGRVEAHSSPIECNSCGDPATETLKGIDYCRECYLEKVLEGQEAEMRKDFEAEHRGSKRRKRDD